MIEDLIAWIKFALRHEPAKFDPQWMQRAVAFAESAFEEWENTILGQISELDELFEEIGDDDVANHYGRNEWYNLKTEQYLKGAVSGLFGGDEEDDADPYDIEQFTWQDFADFLDTGKTYN